MSTKIHEEIDAAHPYKTAVINTYELCAWEEMAERLESDQRAAWRSFYVACGVVGLLCVWIASDHYGAAFGHRPLCGTQSPPPPAVVRSTEVYEL